jgi:hypothetical protein
VASAADGDELEVASVLAGRGIHGGITSNVGAVDHPWVPRLDDGVVHRRSPLLIVLEGHARVCLAVVDEDTSPAVDNVGVHLDALVLLAAGKKDSKTKSNNKEKVESG